MYLAGILGLCALLYASTPMDGGRGSASLLVRPSPQEPASAAQPPAQEPTSDSTAKPAQTPPTDNPPAKNAEKPPAISQKPETSKTTTSAKKKKKAPAATSDPTKTVIHHGSTGEPTTQLVPELTEQQAARQRESTKQLLSSTDATLQKLSGRQLSQEDQDTVTQIRKFMEQAKAADAAGDLVRASKLAVKAHLLSDALAKP